MEYRCVATSPEGFVQQLASCYLPHGYWFHVSGVIPAGKDPGEVDEKLIRKYGIAVSRATRARRKAAGQANLHYLRFKRRFVLVATHGHHAFFEDEAKSLRDARRIPILFRGYSLAVRPGNFRRRPGPGLPAPADGRNRVRVQIAREHYLAMKAYFRDVATHRSAAEFGRELYCVPFEPYAPVRQQMLNVLGVVNARRRRAGLEAVSPRVLRYRRRIVKPFEGGDFAAAAANACPRAGGAAPPSGVG